MCVFVCAHALNIIKYQYQFQYFKAANIRTINGHSAQHVSLFAVFIYLNFILLILLRQNV